MAAEANDRVFTYSGSQVFLVDLKDVIIRNELQYVSFAMKQSCVLKIMQEQNTVYFVVK